MVAISSRKTRKQRVFYGCANTRPATLLLKLPLPVPCPNCGGLLVVAKKNTAQCTQCEEQYSLDQVTVEETAVS
jgi:DNA topoisomerase-1